MKSVGLRVLSLIGYALIMAACALLDVMVGVEISPWVLYLLPIGLATWNFGQPMGHALSAAAGGLMLAVPMRFGMVFSAPGYLYLSVAFKLIALCVVVYLIGVLRKRQVERLHVAGPWAK